MQYRQGNPFFCPFVGKQNRISFGIVHYKFPFSRKKIFVTYHLAFLFFSRLHTYQGLSDSTLPFATGFFFQFQKNLFIRNRKSGIFDFQCNDTAVKSFPQTSLAKDKAIPQVCLHVIIEGVPFPDTICPAIHRFPSFQFLFIMIPVQICNSFCPQTQNNIFCRLSGAADHFSAMRGILSTPGNE